MYCPICGFGGIIIEGKNMDGRKKDSPMNSSKTKSAWLISIVIGILIIAAGIFLLVSPSTGEDSAGNDTVKTFLRIGVFGFCVYCIFKAYQSKDNNRLFIPYLAQGLLNIVLLLLLLTINEKEVETKVLVVIIIACWLMIFGFFEIIHARRSSDNQHRIRNGSLLILAGLAVLIIPLLLRMESVLFLGIVALVFGVFKIAQGLISKVRTDEGNSGGGRSGLF